MRNQTLLTLILSSFLVLSCSHGHRVALNEQVDSNKKEFSTALEWAKSKKDSIDMKISFHNGLSHPIHFDRSAFHMKSGELTGNLNKSYLTVELAPGESRAETLIFNFHTKMPKGQVATLTIDPIYQGTLEQGDKKQITKYTREIPFKD
jgi:hypothetical protein